MRWLLLFSLFAFAREMPAPLAERPFVLPTPTQATLRNGVPVAVVENHEVPKVYVTLSFQAGSFTDPAGKEGLAAATMDLLNEGAGSLDAFGISAELKRLGSDLSTYAGADGAGITVTCLTRNLEPTLALMATVLTQPTFPASEWELRRSQWLADLAYARTNPPSMASRVFDVAFFGGAYQGRLWNETTVAAITPDDMKAWWKNHLVPSQAQLLIGGDTTLAAVQPLLEQHLGGWSGTGAALERPAAPAPLTATRLIFVDKPGAAQSVLLAGRDVGSPTEPAYMQLLAANHILGGQFMSRINLNLREKNGYTYGARSQLRYNLTGTIWSASTQVQTDKTGPALKELLYEIQAVAADRPLTEAELADARSAITSGWPLRFENPGYLLDVQENIRRYGLPADWAETYPARINGVTLAQAQSAWTERVAGQPMLIVVVGDKSKVFSELQALGLPIEERDANGALLAPPAAQPAAQPANP